MFSIRDGEVQWRVDTENNWTTEITTTGVTTTASWYLAGSRVEGGGYVLALSSDDDEWVSGR